MSENEPCAECTCCRADPESAGWSKILGAAGALCRMCVASALSCSGRHYECTECPDRDAR